MGGASGSSESRTDLPRAVPTAGKATPCATGELQGGKNSQGSTTGAGCSRRFGGQQLENLSRRGLVGSRQVGRASSFSSSDDVTTKRGRLFQNAPRSFQSLPEREQGCAPFLQLLSRYLEAGNISVLSVTQAVCALRRVKRCPSTLGVRLVSATYRYGLISVENTTIDMQTDWQEMGR